MADALTQNDPRYPRRLCDLKDAPQVAFVRGELPHETDRAVALVGARRASPEGVDFARDLARALAKAGIWVVSGGAFGIDAAAHQGALAAKGRTLAIFGSALDQPSPRSQRPLFEAIISGAGGWLSEQQGRAPRYAFSRRNRLIAAMADFVVVIEGRAGSGTRYTLESAVRLGRPIGAVTWAPFDERGIQSDWVFARGGFPIRDVGTFLQQMGVGRASKNATGRKRATVDEMASQLGVSAAEALVRLTELELEGTVQAVGGGRYREQ